MKNKNITFFFLYLISCLFILQSCSSDEGSALGSFNFGKADYYRSFLWLHDKPDTLIKVFVAEFNNAALQDNDPSIELELILKDENKLISELKDIELYLNDKKVEFNRFRVGLNDLKENRLFSLSIVFLPNASRKHYSGYISVVSANNIDRVNESEVSNGSEPIAILRWEAQYAIVINPLLLGLLIVTSILIFVLLIWFLLLRRKFFPVFSGGQILIYFSSEETDRISLKGHTQCFLGKKGVPHQSKLKKIFLGTYTHGLTDLDIMIHIKPIAFSLHHDKHFKSKRLACIVEFKNIDVLIKEYPENFGIYGKEVLYNDAKYKINDTISIQYLNSRHQKFSNE
ncbi:MAG: hypothetical protein JXB49_17805 [Bacteroidales bacterium]|nr:hypothetical protein [Bacteroidales bacterium]